MKDYITQAKRTEPDYGPALLRVVKDPQMMKLLHAAMGLATEAGELLDAVKKHVYYGKPLDKTNLFEEGGDIQWYLAVLADYLGYRSFSPMQSKNIAKLKERYPEKFTEEKALNRDLVAERNVLVGKEYIGDASTPCTHRDVTALEGGEGYCDTCHLRVNYNPESRNWE
jgi:NTP pyrophosphatase (non-canonical NTP hydrolase)